MPPAVQASRALPEPAVDTDARCPCSRCKKALTAYTKLREVYDTTDPESPLLPDLKRAVLQAFDVSQRLRLQHLQELYPSWGFKYEGEAEAKDERTVFASENPRVDNMSCDHCMAHNLPCTSEAICRPCQHFNVPCVHRWCPVDPTAMAKICPYQHCPYIHVDSVPHAHPEPQWLIFKGLLPKDGARGEILIHEYDMIHDGMLSDHKLHRETIERQLIPLQEHGLRWYQGPNYNGGKTERSYTEFYPCKCKGALALGGKKASKLETIPEGGSE